MGEGRVAEGAQISLSCASPPSGPRWSAEETTAPDDTNFILLNLHRDVYWVVQGCLDKWRSERTIREKRLAPTLSPLCPQRNTAGLLDTLLSFVALLLFGSVGRSIGFCLQTQLSSHSSSVISSPTHATHAAL